MPSRGLIVLCVLLGVLIFGWFTWRDFSSPRQLREAPVPTISKQPVAFTNRTFDPVTPPTDMPPLAPGESAECDSDFLSNASVRGESRQTDATHATVTITQIKVTLQLNINIWVPTGVTQHVIEHEEGHRQISEYYYQTADKLAERIAATYMGKQVEITGTDLGAESSKMLQQMATDITDEYNKELNSGPTQLLYDAITDHGRNDVIAKDAVAHALKNITIESTQPATGSLSSGVAQFTAAGGALATGTHSITARYSGDANFLSSTFGIARRNGDRGCDIHGSDDKFESICNWALRHIHDDGVVLGGRNTERDRQFLP